MTQENFDINEATELVNQSAFPYAVVGDTVKQFGYWFVLTENGWVPSESGE